LLIRSGEEENDGTNANTALVVAGEENAETMGVVLVPATARNAA
jgi:hypothetical protein